MFICSSSSFFTWYAQRPMTVPHFLIGSTAVLTCMRKALRVAQCLMGRCNSESSPMEVFRLWSLLRAKPFLGWDPSRAHRELEDVLVGQTFCIPCP
jgi:hypothetical protein